MESPAAVEQCVVLSGHVEKGFEFVYLNIQIDDTGSRAA